MSSEHDHPMKEASHLKKNIENLKIKIEIRY